MTSSERLVGEEVRRGVSQPDRVTEVWKAFSSQPLLSCWLCFPCRQCFSEWQRDRFCGQPHRKQNTHTYTHTHTHIHRRVEVKPYFGKSPPTSYLVRHAFHQSWHVYLMITDLFCFLESSGLMAYISFVHCVMSLLFKQQHVLLMHFFEPVSLVIKIFATTNTGS